MKKSTPSRAPKKRTPEQIAGLIADRFVTLHLSDMQGILDPNNEAPEPDGATNDSLFESLIRASNPKYDSRQARLMRLEASIRKQIPESVQSDLRTLLDGWSEHDTARAEAAYLLGVAAGRRMAGGAR